MKFAFCRFVLEMKLLASVILLLVFAVTSVNSKLDSTTEEQIKNSVEAVITVADKIKDHKDALAGAGKAIGPLVSKIGSIAPFLGAAGAFLSIILAFLPKQDSAELKYMKEKFAEVNSKLDIITEKLDGIEKLITFEAQRAAYITAEHDVMFGYKKLKEFYTELEKTPCSNKKECLRKRTKIAERYV